MKAWEMAQKIFTEACPVVRSAEEQTWTDNVDVSAFYDDNLSLDWGSNVPGSGAPEKIMVAAVQALENRGYRVSEKGYGYLKEGLQAFEEKDFIRLHQVSALLRRELAAAEKDEISDYWNYRYYYSFEEYEKEVSFPKAVPVDTFSEKFREQIRASWLAQLVGGAMGTMVEGYTHENLKKAFGDVTGYLREPNTYNDDITFELAFLDAFSQKGYNISSEDIALSWVGLIPCGWSAEELAIRNIKNGIFPPESGTHCNPFNEWIGAQMRAGICGMAAPGNAYLAASLAWRDGEVSHANNGILGEVFNAVMTSLAFVMKDTKEIVRTAMEAIPKDSEYYSVISYAYGCCSRYAHWQDALRDCEQKYQRYNWIHAYPNACCEIIALIYGNGDFRETLHIITMCGIDVDCNAAMIMPVPAIQKGVDTIPSELLPAAFSRLDTYMRGKWRSISMEELVQKTVSSIQNAKKSTGKRRKHSMKKKMMAATLTAAMVLSMGAVSVPVMADDEPYKAALLINGTLGDKSFYDSANEGLTKLQEELGEDKFTFKVEQMGATSADEAKWEPTMYDYCDDGSYDIIICGTYQMMDALTNAANDYPDQKFIFFDETFDFSAGGEENVYNVMYKQNEVSYLIGAMAAMMTTDEDLEMIDASNKNIGFLGGMENSVIKDFLVGYIQGAKDVDPDVKVSIAYVGNFYDSAAGKDMALTQYQNGVDVGFNVAGSAGLGQIEAAVDAGRYAFGVDSDQAAVLPDYAANIPTSALKNVGNSLIRAIKADMEGNLAYGTLEYLGLADEGVELVEDSHYEEVVPEEIRTKIDELKQQIIDGEITVPTALGDNAMSDEDIQALIDSVKAE